MNTDRHRRSPVRSVARLSVALLAGFLMLDVGLPTTPTVVQAQGQARMDVLIKFTGRPRAAELSLVRNRGGQVRRSFRLVRAISATLPQAAIAALRRHPRVQSVEPDGQLFLLDTELDNAWGVKRIGAGDVHATGNQGTGVRVAVIDSGIDYTHPDLAANYAGGYDFVNDDADPMDDNGHGTHVAGTIAAVDNDSGVVGAAPKVRLYALKAFNASGSGDFSDVIAALEWAVDNGVQITNNSYGATEDPGSIVEDAFIAAQSSGVVHVAAAGNTGTCGGGGDTVNYPARYSSLIAVAATDSSDARACFSSTGPAVELAAPGSFIFSTIPGGGYFWQSGTSMASPHVAGTAALLIRAGIPDSNGNGRINDEIRAALTATAEDLGSPGHDPWYGFGLVDAPAAVGALGPPPPSVVVDLTSDQVSYESGVDTTAALSAAVADEEHAPISGLDAGAFATLLDGNVPVFATPFSETATPGTYTATLDISTVAEGGHTAEVTVTDTRGLSGDGITAFVVEPPAPPADPVATITSSGTATEAGEVPASMQVDLDKAAPEDLTITYSVSGSATAGVDFQPLAGQVTILNGESSATFDITPIDDTDVENDEIVVVTLTAGSGYTVGQPGSANITITSDDDPADMVVSSVTGPGAVAPGDSIDVTHTTKNQGAGDAAASTTAIYLSLNFAVDESDVLLGTHAVPALTSGAEHTATTAVVIPSETTGAKYRVIVRANDDGAVEESTGTNNTKWITLDVGPDLRVTDFDAPAGGAPGASLTVSDTTSNQGAGEAAASETRFYLSTNVLFDASDEQVGTRAIGVLGAQASSTSSATVLIPEDAEPGSYFLLARADGGDAVAESVENNNVRFASFKIGSDFLVSALDAPSGAGSGETITLTDTTVNQGNTAAGASITRFHLSADFALDAGDPVLGERVVPALAPGASDTQSTDVTIPGGTAPDSYQIIAVADADDEYVETSEANNTRSATVQVGSDLVISAFSGPPTAGTGTTIVVDDTTKNQGAGAAAASTTHFYLSDDFSLDGLDVSLGTRTVAALPAGATDSGSSSLTIPSGTTAGTWYLLAHADGGDAIAETSETNNVKFATIKVGPDLVVSALDAPSGAGPGETITLTDTTLNQGAGDAPASVTRFHLSSDFTLDPGDTVLGERVVPPLGPGLSDMQTTQVTLPANTPTGGYHIIAEADANQEVDETAENNNTRSTTAQIGSDLTVSAFSGPTSAGAGATITVTDTTKNTGSGQAAASVTRFYLSDNIGLDAQDVDLGSRAVPTLNSGQSDAGSSSVTIPSNTVSGNYYLLAKADGDETVPETSETNNVRFWNIKIGADLIVSVLSAPAAAGRGVPFTVNDTTKNQGTSTAASSTTRFYLSTNIGLDGGDTPLGERSIGMLTPGQTDAGSASLTIPTSVSEGTYFLLAKADADDTVVETQEGNNLRFRTIRIGPDLTVSAVSSPFSVTSGSPVSVTDTTKNQGGDQAGASVTAIYLSSNTILDAGDPLLATRAVPPLAGGATDQTATSVTIPAGLSPGFYYLIVRADDQGAVAETQENNNVRLRLVRVLAGS